jgi:hypothetical protein
MKTGIVVKSISFSPIVPWAVMALMGLAVIGLTLWAYRARLRGTSGRWRWIALGLRLAAVLLCLLAALRPSLIVQHKVKQSGAILVMLDESTSMQLRDEVGGKSRWEVAQKFLSEAREAAKTLGPNLEMKFFGFASSVHELKSDAKDPPPQGRQTAIGTALTDVIKRQLGSRVASIFLVSDGAANAGLPPLVAAQTLKSQQIPVYPIALGSESAGAATSDIAAKEVVAGPTVFVKNKLQINGVAEIHGFPNEPIEVELLVDDQKVPNATTTIKTGEGGTVSIRGLEYIPQTPGEKKITLRIKPREKELVRTNNEISTFVTVLKGGLNVLYLQGRNFTWEPRYLTFALDASPDIHVDFKVSRQPVRDGKSGFDDADFLPGHYDIYILGDLPADFLSDRQHELLAQTVKKGAGLMLLGGRSSFGPGGWANTPVGDILPTEIHPGDPQMEPEGGIKVVPNPKAVGNYILRLASSPQESQRIWDDLPPIPGANALGRLKAGANELALTEPGGEAVMVSQDVQKGRVLEFGGETWPWYRKSPETQLAHRKFWRQAIFWLAHKEDQGENSVKLHLDRRRVTNGEKLELTVVVRNAKNEPITDAEFKTTVTFIGPNAKPDESKPEPVSLFNQGDEARGTHFIKDQDKPGEYKVTVTASRNGKPLGSDSARFLVYQDDRELEHPAADHSLLRQLAEVTGGQFLTPEQLPKYLKSLSSLALTDDVRQTEHKVWDNWFFFLLFVGLLTLEWWLRKRNGWV